MKWSPQQDSALKAVNAWLKDPNGPQVFRLFGYAGTGKTTLAVHLAEQVGGDVCFGAFTGKAALVMRSKGCVGASTIHSLIYNVVRDGTRTIFELKNDRDCVLSDCALFVVDEVSMVGEKLGRDAETFGCKILALGDPAQLPPVKDAGYFTEQEPDFMLTEIHRQARDNPIIAMSIDVREGRGLRAGSYGDSIILPRADLDPDKPMSVDQILVGTNRTRMRWNGRFRERQGHGSSLVPQIGERLICLRNNSEKGLLNGSIWTVREATQDGNGDIQMYVASEDDGINVGEIDVKVHRSFFEGREHELSFRERMKYDAFTYGYAITTHKAQGSQWNDVLLLDESRCFGEASKRWLYTGLTRAAEKVTVVQ